MEITSAEVRITVCSGRGADFSVLSARKAVLPAGIVSESYSFPPINDREAFIRRLAENLETGTNRARAGLCLPDGVFRVQTLEFEELPKKTSDRERLIRWRLEKSAAFDLSETLLRHQILRRGTSGFTVLVCAVKRTVIEQCERTLSDLGIETWSIGLSSLAAFNFYAPYMTKRSASFALTHVTEDSFATVVSESGGVRFYRFKEIKRTGGGEMTPRLAREIADSLHFYTHMDRSQQADVGYLYVSGEEALATKLAGELRQDASLEVEALQPDRVLASLNGTGPEMAAAIGAGKTL